MASQPPEDSLPDWNLLYQQARRRKSWRRKKKGDWNRRAADFAKRTADSDFARLFIERMAPEPHWRVLDVGCGPGTLALPLAPLVKEVTALDFSPAMLEQLADRQQAAGISNIHGQLRSWDDEWQEIPPHDVCIAARSLAVTDLRAALVKLAAWSRHKVFIADRVGAGPFDPELFASLGRDFEPGPDYIYTVNILFQLGIRPTIDYLEFDQQRTYADRNTALAACRWMVEDLDRAEELRLAAYVDERLTSNQDGTVSFSRNAPVTWAFISWEV
ncbi:MAG: class I SAM-dependent methyltransferase [Thermodesulfobacteriota bacterium]